jgi:hypothetical protein
MLLLLEESHRAATRLNFRERLAFKKPRAKKGNVNHSAPKVSAEIAENPRENRINPRESNAA